MNEVIYQLEQKLHEFDKEAKIVYLSYFGSKLYGTNTPESDIDLKGLYLPSIYPLIHNKKLPIITITSKKGTSGRNTSEDIDAQLWSIHYWLELLRKGDTNAIDLLFSFTNSECILFCDPRFKSQVFNEDEAFKFIDMKHLDGYIGYAYFQAKKYGLKGSRIDTMDKAAKILRDYIQNYEDKVLDENSKLSDIWSGFKYTMNNLCQYDHFEFHEASEGEKRPHPSVSICGKEYQSTIKIVDAIKRLEEGFQKYGQRAIEARNNENVDWKAVHHAIRCICQTKELLTTKCIRYPLKNASWHLAIKRGEYSWEECEKFIVSGIEELKKIQDEMPENAYEKNDSLETFHNYFLDWLYFDY